MSIRIQGSELRTCGQASESAATHQYQIKLVMKYDLPACDEVDIFQPKISLTKPKEQICSECGKRVEQRGKKGEHRESQRKSSVLPIT